MERELTFFGLQSLSTDQHFFERFLNVLVFIPDSSLDLSEQPVIWFDLVCLSSLNVTHFLIDHIPLHEYLVVHSVELIIPGLGNILHVDDRIQRITAQLLVVRLVFVTVQSSLDAVLEVICVVTHKVEAVALFRLIVVFEDCVFQTTCPEADDWSSS